MTQIAQINEALKSYPAAYVNAQDVMEVLSNRPHLSIDEAIEMAIEMDLDAA